VALGGAKGGHVSNSDPPREARGLGGEGPMERRRHWAFYFLGVGCIGLGGISAATGGPDAGIVLVAFGLFVVIVGAGFDLGANRVFRPSAPAGTWTYATVPGISVEPLRTCAQCRALNPARVPRCLRCGHSLETIAR
jgi:hypothetical protein